MKKTPSLILVLINYVVIFIISAIPCLADGVVSGTITAASDSSAVAGATVILVGNSGQYGAISDTTGSYTISDVADGNYTVTVSAPGYNLSSTLLTASTGASSNHTLASSGRLFQNTPAFGADIRAIVADGRTGVFYAATNVVPQIFRTFNYGGSWSPLTLSVDDSSGAPSSAAGLSSNSLTKSGFPGEIAMLLDNKVYFSQNFGNSWVELTVPSGFYASSIYWGHKGSTSILLAVHGTTIWRADMSSSSPSLEAYTTTLLTSTLERLTVGNGGSAPYVAVVNAAGSQVDLYTLTATGSFVLQESITINTPAGQPYYISIGGNTTTDGAPPNTIVVGSVVFSPSYSDKLSVILKSSTATNFGAASQNTFDLTSSGCNSYYGSVAPNSGGTLAYVNNGLCWLQLTASGGSISGTPSIIYNATRGTFDAEYNGSSNNVILSPDEGRGVVKSIGVDGSGVPYFNLSSEASSGLASGGIAVNGITAPIVEDTIYAPASSSLMATTLKPKGGNRSLVTTDGGETMQTVVNRGGYATDWWTDADSNTWLLFGHGSSEGTTLLSAFRNWTSSSTLLSDANVTNGTTTNLTPELNPSYTSEVTAIKGARGSNIVFIGAQEVTGVDGTGYAIRRGVVMRGSLSDPGTPQIDSLLRIGSDSITAPVRTVEYCPTAGSHSSLADVLFVGTGYFSTISGALYRVENASSESPSISTIESVPGDTGPINDIRADCATGTVYAGIGNGETGTSGAGGLYRSINGGVTFSIVSTLRTDSTSLAIKSIEISPLDSNIILTSGGKEGYLYRTGNGGYTWELINDPTSGGQSFTTEGIKDLELPETTSTADNFKNKLNVLTSSTLASVGTGGGLFTAAISAASSPISVPSRVRTVKVSRSKNSAALTWKAPVSDGGSSILNYTISIAKRRTLTISGSKRKANISKLVPKSTYKATIKAVNIAGESAGVVAKIKKY